MNIIRSIDHWFDRSSWLEEKVFFTVLFLGGGGRREVVNKKPCEEVKVFGGADLKRIWNVFCLPNFMVKSEIIPMLNAVIDSIKTMINDRKKQYTNPLLMERH